MSQFRGPTAPYARLAEALKRAPLEPVEREALKTMPGFSDTYSRIISAAKSSRAVNADAFLSICHVKGWDPLTCRAADDLMPPWRGTIVWPHLALALKHEAEVLELGVRPCARRAKVSHLAWHRASHGLPMCVDNLFRLCAHLDRHPHDVTATAPMRPVSRETIRETAIGSGA